MYGIKHELMKHFLYSTHRKRCLGMRSLSCGATQRKCLVKKMVYCTKCGTKNEEDAVICVNCKEPLRGSQTTFMRERRRKESECFGLPHGGSIAGLVIGLIIILWGVTTVLDIPFGNYLWAIVIVIFGTLMVAGALYSMSRRR